MVGFSSRTVTMAMGGIGHSPSSTLYAREGELLRGNADRRPSYRALLFRSGGGEGAIRLRRPEQGEAEGVCVGVDGARHTKEATRRESGGHRGAGCQSRAEGSDPVQ